LLVAYQSGGGALTTPPSRGYEHQGELTILSEGGEKWVQIKGFPFFLFLNVPGFKPRLFSILDGVSSSHSIGLLYNIIIIIIITLEGFT